MLNLLDFLGPDNDPSEGERLRDRALGKLRAHRPSLTRRLMRVFLEYLLDFGPSTSDALRLLVEIPAGIDPRCVGAAVRALHEADLITSVGREKTRRPVAHARVLELWAVRDEAAARLWLLANPAPELVSADSADPYAV